MENINQNSLMLDDGMREYRFTNKYGMEIATVHFRPADTGMVTRFERML